MIGSRSSAGRPFGTGEEAAVGEPATVRMVRHTTVQDRRVPPNASFRPWLSIHDVAPRRRRSPCDAQSRTPVIAPSAPVHCQHSVPAVVQGWGQPGIVTTPVARRATARDAAPHRPVNSWQLSQ